MAKNGGGAAFPNPAFGKEGMTLRDYFAAKVLQGVLSNLGAYNVSTDRDVARKCYDMADAMLKAREA
jgi:hypothetical protein